MPTLAAMPTLAHASPIAVARPRPRPPCTKNHHRRGGCLVSSADARGSASTPDERDGERDGERASGAGDARPAPGTSTSAGATSRMRAIVDKLGGLVLSPSGVDADSGPSDARSRSASGGALPFGAFVRDAVRAAANTVTASFDEYASEAPERKALDERRRKARTLVAKRRKLRRDAQTRAELVAARPALEVFKLNQAQRREIGLDCDEMHFLPVGDASGWSAALLRYRPEGGVMTKRPIVMVPGCASNGMTFDVDREVSLPRYLTDRGHEVWIIETRGVGYARRWTRPRSDYMDRIGVEDGDGAIMEVPAMRSVGFGLWDFDTLLNEDLFTSCEYIAEVCKRGDLAGIGHSMGGMLLASLAAIGPKARDIGHTSSWSITRVVTLASCLECSKESDPKSPASVYARFSALAGHLPRGLTANPSTTTVQLPIAPASVATAEAFSLVLGPPPQSDGDGDGQPPDAAKAFWRNSVSPVTCHPGATNSEYLRRLLLRGFNNVPLSLLLQMATLFTPGGMRSRDPDMGVDDTSVVRAKPGAADDSTSRERLKYLDALEAASPPVCAIAGDVDPIFPPNQVKSYAARANAEYHCFGDPRAARDDPDAHFSHYDVICGRFAPKLVFPVVAEFVARDADGKSETNTRVPSRAEID